MVLLGISPAWCITEASKHYDVTCTSCAACAHGCDQQLYKAMNQTHSLLHVVAPSRSRWERARSHQGQKDLQSAVQVCNTYKWMWLKAVPTAGLSSTHQTEAGDSNTHLATHRAHTVPTREAACCIPTYSSASLSVVAAPPPCTCRSGKLLIALVTLLAQLTECDTKASLKTRRQNLYFVGSQPRWKPYVLIGCAGDQPIIDRHDLYQKAVQHPPGDIYWMNKFYCKYISPEVKLAFQTQQLLVSWQL
eukprot:GHUV01023231.1.p1 GENE.GHUV01023231.1~~GHUV01023231.1.p1  ORF type:complete len:248 (+),score=33.11 GHUV01023231.1:373-1116(+)